MKITQIRNATIWVEYHQTKILVDPWLGPKEYMPGFVGAIHSEKKYPVFCSIRGRSFFYCQQGVQASAYSFS